MKLFIDANILLRYLVRDNQEALHDCTALFEAIEQGTIRPYISTIVFLEVYWVLTSYYHVSKAKAQTYIDTMLQARGLVIVEKTDFHRAFALHKKTGVKLADCLVATQVGKGIALCTYDAEFRKFPFLSAVTPAQLVA